MATTEEPSISHKRKSVDDHIVSSTLPLSTRAGEYAVSTEASGAVGTTEYRLFFFNTTDNQRISPWHDVPLRNGDYFNCLIEIPKFTKAKMEIATKEKFNPIAQDIKKGKLREYHGPIFWNYGCLPQTWEDPTVFHPELEVYGDNDPVDVVEIGSKALPTGTICKIKILGAIAMIDDGELDWKMVGISVEDPLSSLLNDIADVDRNHPGTLSGIREWFRWYKTPDEKPCNKFGFDEEYLPREEALKIIHETHAYWFNLKQGKSDRGSLSL